MATKAVVCPECASEVAPGRYACSECGSLLAAVSATPRPPLAEVASDPEVSLLADDDEGAREPGAEAEPEQAHEVPAVRSPAAAAAAAVAPDRRDEEPDIEVEVDEDRPLAAFAAPSVAVADLADLAEPAEPAESTDPKLGRAGPVWPPTGDRGADPPAVRPTPAGAWLPPSAHLDGLALPEPGGSTLGIGRSGGNGASADGAAAHRSASGLARIAASFDLADDAPRQVIGAGAGLAAVGFLLPWANVLAGSGLLGDYFTQWGIAGPGHWIVVTLLAALAALSFAGGRFAGWPLGLIAISLATLVVGLLWPYLFGFLGRSVGVWTVLAGALVLGAGGVLERRVRHDPPDRAV